MTTARRGDPVPGASSGSCRATSLRVHLVDDSATVRAAFRHLLAADPDIAVVGESVNGQDAVEAVPRTRPDLVLMDVLMPKLDGLEATAALMSRHPVPIVIASELVGTDASLNFRALEAGAVDLMRKPTLQDIGDPRYQTRFLRLLRALAAIPVVTRVARVPRPGPAPASAAPALETLSSAGAYRWLVVGASTGGPPALVDLFSAIKPTASPAVVVQHMMPGFTAGLVDWLSDRTRRPVELAQHGRAPEPGVIYIAAEGSNCTLRQNRFHQVQCPPDSLFCPSVDALFRSIVTNGTAAQTIAVLLTGMGSDGAAALRALRDAGAHTIAQNEATSVVFGMPRAAIELGAATAVLGLGDIAPRLNVLLPGRSP